MVVSGGESGWGAEAVWGAEAGWGTACGWLAGVPGADTQDGGHAGGVVKKVCQRCHSHTAKTNALCPDESVSEITNQ